jgi:uncharacterized protein (TIGR00288 family)
MSDATADTKSMALFCDFENVALGVREARYQQFDISKVLERLLLKGSIVVKKAYCDWERYREFKAAMHQASFELIEIPHLRMSGKNSADIRMVVDALDLCYTKSHVDTFVIISGDSDFSPLVSKLRENAKTVIGVGVKNSTSELLISNCDEFIYYDDLVRPARSPRRRAAAAGPGPLTTGGAAAAATSPVAATAGASGEGQGSAQASRDVPTVVPAAAGERPSRRRRVARKPGEQAAGVAADAGPAVPEPEVGDVPLAAAAPAEPDALEVSDPGGDRRVQQALELIVDTLEALVAERGEDEKIWGSMVKQTLRRRKPGFSENYYGFRSFNRLLEEARDRGLIELDRDEKSGGYTVRSLT